MLVAWGPNVVGMMKGPWIKEESGMWMDEGEHVPRPLFEEE